MKPLSWRLSRSCRLIEALRERVTSSHSARSLKRSLERNRCRVNGRIERFASSRVEKGDLIEFVFSQEEPKLTVPSILYENDDLLILDKPAGVVCSDDMLRSRLFLAHRLDKDTTGVLLFGKTKPVVDQLHEQFKERRMEKEYLALVDGTPHKQSGVIISNLTKKGSYQGQTIWGSSSNGLYAETAWSIHTAYADRALLHCKPKTGRTHQIRVHLAEMGHPILVDRQYASHFRSKIFATRPLLHAWRLQFIWKGKELLFEAPLPEDLYAHTHR